MPHRVTVVFGTRPEAIKLAPVVLALRADPRFECRVCVTAQHRQMLDQVLNVFGITPDTDLDLMTTNQSLASLTSRAVERIHSDLASFRPELVLVQGDTTTTFCAALSAFYQRIPVAHVEAGLRTGNLEAPWPEEANRVLTTRLAALHFAPTEWARQNLLREGVRAETVKVTGNTVVDALLWVRRRVTSNREASVRFQADCGMPKAFVESFVRSDRRTENTNEAEPKLILVTGHRRESFGNGFERICKALRQIVESAPNAGIVYPVHLNPNVQEPVRRLLGDHPRIALIPPLGYEAFIWLMDKVHFVLTDSGGVQEEAPTLGKPVLVMRDTTERPEGVEAGTSMLVGTDPEMILTEALRLLEDGDEYERRSRIRNPYGEGNSTELIVSDCARFLSKDRLDLELLSRDIATLPCGNSSASFKSRALVDMAPSSNCGPR